MEWRCAYGLGITLWLFFLTFSVNLVFFQYKMLSKYIENGYLVGATPLSVFHRLFWNFADFFLHEMKICMWFWYITLIIFSHFFCFVNISLFFVAPALACDLGVQVSIRLSVRPFVRPSTVTMGVLWAQLLLVFYRSFWNFADVFFMVWGCAYGLDIIVRLFLSLFPLCEHSHFSTSMYRQWVPCERNFSYNFIPIFFKLCTCFLHGLKICMWFGYNPCINFCYFFDFANFVIFWPQILWKCYDSGYLVSATPYTISCLSLCNFARLFFPWFEDVHVVWI